MGEAKGIEGYAYLRNEEAFLSFGRGANREFGPGRWRRSEL
jgi:hypothetical protein